MTTEKSALPASSWRPLRLITLVRLRWLAIAGQALSVLVVALVLDFPLPLLPCLGLIGLSAVLNLYLMVRPDAGRRLSANFATLQLAYDSLQLGGLLWLTGGLQNPFSLLLLAPISVSATTLSRRATLGLALLVVAIATLLAVSHLPLPWYETTPLHFDPLYTAGIWISLLLGVGFIAAYTNRVANEARQLADALAATELTLSRRQQLSALDGLAAAAAHELGTPLSTIALAAKEMRAELADGPVAEDADLIIEQIARCRAILGKLRSLENETGDPFTAVPLGDLVAEVVRPYRRSGKEIVITASSQSSPGPVVARNVGLLYGLGNLIENAVYFARSRVEIRPDWQGDAVSIAIVDDGPGFPADRIAELGEPYFTTRAGKSGGDPASPGGLGLGIFIARTLLERTGARLSFRNLRPDGHAEVVVDWPAGIGEIH